MPPGDSVADVDTSGHVRQSVLAALPWLLFQAFPVLDLVVTDRPAWLRVLGAAGLVVFTAVYLRVMSDFTVRSSPPWDVVGLVVLGMALTVGFGPSWTGLMIYLSAAAASVLPGRWMWLTVLAATAVAAGVLAVAGEWGMFVLPVLCPLTAFALRGTRYLITVNRELQEAREELASNAVAEERLRFARDLHDLLGHSLSLIALKSELARRLVERDPARAAAEMADVEDAARRALAEVRDAVSGYRQVSCAQALTEARSALGGAGVTVRLPDRVPSLPGTVDAALGWVVREATTNVLRHSGAGSVTVELTEDGVQAVLTVTDDGPGTGQRVPVLGSGSGLAGLRERLTALGGELRAGPLDRGGYRLRARVPLQPAVAVAPR
jgi:two-component system sensor histidine kinase DesK